MNGLMTWAELVSSTREPGLDLLSGNGRSLGEMGRGGRLGEDGGVGFVVVAGRAPELVKGIVSAAERSSVERLWSVGVAALWLST